MRFPRVLAVIGLALLASCTSESSSPLTTPATPNSTVPETTTTTLPPPPPSESLTLAQVARIANDNLQSKSIVHSGTGLFFTQNMMYRHNVAVFDRDGNEVALISDSVNLADFGIDTKGRSPQVKGSPVEAAFTSDGKYAYVSNYKMYGKGWNPVADDSCQSRNWDPSYVYRIDTTTFAIDQVIEVGAVPKFLLVSPDDRTLVVSNFCSEDVSIVDLASAREVERVFVGLHPRGIAITKDSQFAYVTVMGGGNVTRIDLATYATEKITAAGFTPRHVVLSPDDSVIYVTNNKSGTVRKVSTTTGELLGVVSTGREPRTMVMSTDGTALYVVNYLDDVLAKVRTSDMMVIQQVPTGDRPIGVTLDAQTSRIWVANYSGSLLVFEDA
ncbi:MAG: YncE family protein [Ilumatobacteraceae bacterium]